MKKAYLITLLFILFLGRGYANNDTHKPTVICGQVENIDINSSNVISVLTYDFVSDNNRLATNISKTNGRFHNSFTMSHKHDIAINYNGHFYMLMAEPSDSIFVSIDAKTKEVIFYGDKAEFNNQLNKAKRATMTKFNEIYVFDLETNIDGVIQQLSDKMQVIKDTLEIYSQNNDVSNEVKEYILDDNLYGFANFLLFQHNKKHSSKRYELLTLQAFDIYNNEKAHNYMYAVHIFNMMHEFINSNKDLRVALSKKRKDIHRITDLMLTHILSQPKSVVRDIMLAHGLKKCNELAINGGKVYDERYLDKDNYYNQKFLELYILPILKPEESSTIDSQISMDVNINSGISYINREKQIEKYDTQNPIDYIIGKYKGKVIYLDVWATWCAPCILEMGYAKDLHSLYQDTDDVVFVNLCMESKYQSWITLVNEKKILGENYFLNNNDAAKLIMSHYKLAGYPSYILIDKEGNIVTTSAFRPSQLYELSVQINKQINK